MEFLKRVPSIRFMALRRYWYVISALVVAGSIALVMVRGLNLTVDFTGGIVLEVGFSQPVDLERVRSALDAGGIEDFQVRTYGTASEIEVRLPPAETGAAADDAKRVLGALSTLDSKVKLNRTESVGPQVSQLLGEQAAMAVLMTLLLVLIYIAMRFRWRFGVGSLVASLEREDGELRKFHGLARSLVANAVTGVTEGFKKELDIVGVGYRAELKGKQVHFALATRTR